MKKILVYDNNFYPELSSLAQLYTDLCDALSEEFEMNVICAAPSYTGKVEEAYLKNWLYKETYKKVNIFRVKVKPFNKEEKRSRVINILGYFFRALKATLYIKKVDVILAVSQPPILGGFLGVLGKILKRAKLIYNIQDFNPEQIMAVNYSRNKILLKILLAVDKFSCRHADSIIVVGKDMKETIKRRFQTEKKIPRTVSVNNWVDEEKLTPLFQNKEVNDFRKRYHLQDKFVFMYSGNIGLIYDLQNLLKVMEKFKEMEKIAFVFIGEGNVKHKLEKYVNQHNMKNVIFIPYQDNEKILYSLNAADVHWVVNVKGMKGVACPSKLYGVMAVGKPVLGVLEQGTEAREMIEQASCGYVTEPGDYKTIQMLIQKMYEERETLSEMGMRGRSFLCKNLYRKKSIHGYKNEINRVMQKNEEMK